MTSMRKNLSRDKLPTGRPTQYSNLVELKEDFGGTINQDKVTDAVDKLGHHSDKVVCPDFTLTKSRDLSFYRQTEAIFNVLRDNEKLQT